MYMKNSERLPTCGSLTSATSQARPPTNKNQQAANRRAKQRVGKTARAPKLTAARRVSSWPLRFALRAQLAARTSQSGSFRLFYKSSAPRRQQVDGEPVSREPS